MPKDAPSKPVFVFIDESGNFDFSERGTRHFVMAALITSAPRSSGATLQQLRYQLLIDGVDLAHFHATQDKQLIRNRVFAELAELSSVTCIALWVEKRTLPKNARSKVSLYGLMARDLAKRLRLELKPKGFTQVVLIFDKVLLGSELNAFNAQIKPVLGALDMDYRIYFHGVNFDYNGQIADYLAWANYVALEKGELRPIQTLPQNLRAVHKLEVK
jgi:hypothetical protein